MDVFLSRLSYLTTQHELESIVLSTLAKKLHIPFTEEPELKRCTILELQDANGNTECHGLIKITPDTAAQWFIKHSHDEKIHNKRLLAHQYIVRDSSWKPAFEGDKRRPDLKKKVKTTEPSYVSEGIDKFHVEH